MTEPHLLIGTDSRPRPMAYVACAQCLADAIDFPDALPLLDLQPREASSKLEEDDAVDACLQTSKTSRL